MQHLNKTIFEIKSLFQERSKQRNLRVHEKTTYATRINFKTASMIKPADSDEEKDKDEDSDKAMAVKDDPQFTLAVTRGKEQYVIISYAYVDLVLYCVKNLLQNVAS